MDPFRSRAKSMDRAAAERVAATALGVVAGDPQRLGLFLALSGVGPETLAPPRPSPHSWSPCWNS